MAKSNLQLLQEAIAAGDLDKAKSLTEKMAKKTQPKVKPKRVAKPRRDLTVYEMNESDYLASSRAGGTDLSEGRKFVGPDGKEHTYAKRVSMSGVKFTNNFKPEEYEKLPPKLEKFDAKQQKRRKRVARRPPAEKIKVRCSICRDEVAVYPWEAATVDGESNFRCSKKSCVKAR